MKVYGLIGYPLIHSFSKKYFTDKFEKEAIRDCLFELFPLLSIESFPALLAEQRELCGLAVTIPYKQSVIPYLTQIDEEAKLVGAVNCISVYGSSLTGFNTDVLGFEKSFVPLLQSHHTRALVLGTGGASRAVQYVLNKIGMPFTLVSRNPSLHKSVTGYNEVDRHLLDAHPVIINCSPVGMMPHENQAPLLPYELLSKNNYLYDLVYKPAETMFLKKGAERGAVVKNGYEMLLIQAEENWRIWNEGKGI
jgi:shikimate dehydrogenase